MNEDVMLTEAIDKAVIEGTARCRNAQLQGSSVLHPATMSYEVGIDTHCHNLRVLGHDELQAYYIQLLTRALTFVEFCRSNVGVSADYPLRIKGESQEATQAFHRHLTILEHITGLLTEI